MYFLELAYIFTHWNEIAERNKSDKTAVGYNVAEIISATVDKADVGMYLVCSSWRWCVHAAAVNLYM